MLPSRKCIMVQTYSTPILIPWDSPWVCGWNYRIARKFRRIKFSQKLIWLSFRDFIFADSDPIAIINDVNIVSQIKIFVGGNKSVKILPAKLSSYTVLQDLINNLTATIDSLWKGVEPPGSSCVREGHPHPRHERSMKDHTSHFILGRKVDCCHGTDTLAVEDNLVGTEVVFLPQCRPRGLNVGIDILFWGFTCTDSVSWIVKRKNVTVYSRR